MKEKDKKGRNTPEIFNRGYLAKVKSASKRKEREILAKTSLMDLIK